MPLPNSKFSLFILQRVIEIDDNKANEPYYIEISDDEAPSMSLAFENERREREKREKEQRERQRREREARQIQEERERRLNEARERERRERERREQEDERLAREIQEQLDRETAEALQNQNSNPNTPVNAQERVRQFLMHDQSPISHIPVERHAPRPPRSDPFSELLRAMHHVSWIK